MSFQEELNQSFQDGVDEGYQDGYMAGRHSVLYNVPERDGRLILDRLVQLHEQDDDPILVPKEELEEVIETLEKIKKIPPMLMQHVDDNNLAAVLAVSLFKQEIFKALRGEEIGEDTF